MASYPMHHTNRPRRASTSSRRSDTSTIALVGGETERPRRDDVWRRREREQQRRRTERRGYWEQLESREKERPERTKGPKSESSGQEARAPPAPNPAAEKPPVVGFWDPSLSAVRRQAVRLWVYTTVILILFILSVLSIYWGVFSHLPENLGTLTIFVVDMDAAPPYNTSGHKPFIGPSMVALAEEYRAQGNTLGFTVVAGDAYDNDPVAVRQAVYDWEAWGAVVINPNASALLFSSLEEGNKTFDPAGACQFTYVGSRDETNINSFILPIMADYLTAGLGRAGKQWSQQALEAAAGDKGPDTTLLSHLRDAPQLLNPGIGFSTYDLRPFNPLVGIPAVSIGLIYLVILSFFSFSFYLPIHAKYISRPAPHLPVLKPPHYIVWRWLSTTTAYVFLSLAYSSISLAYGINFSGSGGAQRVSSTYSTSLAFGNSPAYGSNSFLVYWALNFFAMMALGLACENVAMIVGAPWVGLWLIFWVITNVSTAFYDVDIEPGFYRWGYAWPLHHVVQGAKQILFDLHSQIGINFAVLIAWAVVNTALFPFACWFMKWKKMKGVNEYWR
ncbi:uncharacterized protein J3D65DRAFT_602461 [Phyllosticta citribraziliensis]|uniref:DUF3533 domain-containing protein n=1 Tax=Phyllosticta citribraziliensis TaxID=989973 RepID=A0ABR1LTE4_9PEZI